MKWGVSAVHHQLMVVQWGLEPEPENFDQQINVYYQWLATRNPLWVERGVFSSLCLKGKNVMELSCGDGFNTRNFYSLRSNKVIACDYNKKALQTAQKKNNADNISYLLADIRTEMPIGQFENIIWDAAIEHFTEEEIAGILYNIKLRLTPDGILSGYTILERKEKQLSHHEHEFKDKEELGRLLNPHFKNVTVFETVWPERHNLYFWASDSVLPFDPTWEGKWNTS